jgi:hypothetical protein
MVHGPQVSSVASSFAKSVLRHSCNAHGYSPGSHPAVRGCMSQATLGAIGLAVAATCCASLVAAQEQQDTRQLVSTRLN